MLSLMDLGRALEFSYFNSLLPLKFGSRSLRPIWSVRDA